MAVLKDLEFLYSSLAGVLLILCSFVNFNVPSLLFFLSHLIWSSSFLFCVLVECSFVCSFFFLLFCFNPLSSDLKLF